MKMTLLWNTLSPEAKSIIACLLGEQNDRMHEVTLVLGKRPLREGRVIPQWQEPVTCALLDEIKAFAENEHLAYAIRDIEDGRISLRIAASRKRFNKRAHR